MDRKGPRAGVFVSYSHRDGIWLEKLRPHLGSLARERGFDVDFWDDTRIRPGTAWEAELMDALQSARVAILLVSSRFLNSGYIGDNELPLLLEGAQSARVTVLPVILSPCRWTHHAVLGAIQTVNPPDQPLQGLSAVRREEVFLRLTELVDAALRGADAAVTSAPTSRAAARVSPAATPVRLPSAAPMPLPPVKADDDWARVVFKSLAEVSLLFKSIRGDLRLYGRSPRPQPRLLEHLVQRCIGRDRGRDESEREASAASLFELLVPAELKSRFFSAPGVLLALDAVTARIPWELLRDGGTDIGLRCAILRKTIAERFTPHPVCDTRIALVLAAAYLEDQSFASLPGAEHEARDTAAQFQAAGFAVDCVIDEEPVRALGRLLAQPCRVLHLTGHGVFELVLSEGTQPVTGFVVASDLYFTAAEVEQMRVAPEVVFLNAGDLGRHATPAAPSPGSGLRLAASLPDQFLAIGTRAVVAPVGSIEDAAAVTFASTFYAALLGGADLGTAVLSARRAAHAAHPASNTWGQYLAYGDPEYRLLPPPIKRRRTARRALTTQSS